MSDSSAAVGTADRPLRVAIIGSGPSGFYAAEGLYKNAELKVTVDMYDRLPTPFGLVRGGVAPDHQNIKKVTRVYEKIAANEGFRFLGNVELGKDISVEELKSHYDQIIYAYGSATDNSLGIPGEDLTGSYSATEFVGWYNGHPDFKDRQFDLTQEAAVVVGVGNVAMDVTRTFAEDPDVLAKSDMTSYAVDALRKTNVKTVYVLGRRGVAQAAFTPKEIKEIGGLDSAELVVAPEEVELDEHSKAFLAEEKKGSNFVKNVDYLTEKSQGGEEGKQKKVVLKFLTSPVEILGDNGKVTGVKIEKNELYKDDSGRIRPRGTGNTEVLNVGLVFRSVGYRGVPVEGVPFNEKSGTISNDAGRVTDPQSGEARAGEYVVGWAKRGPSGLIGTNRADSFDTVKAMVEDLPNIQSGGDKTSAAVDELLKSKNVTVISFDDWKILDAEEVKRGEAAGKVREKFTDIQEMVDAVKAAKG